MHIQKILIRGPNWVGDAVLAIPAMKAVREHFPQAEITLMIRPWVAGLFTAAPFIDALWSHEKPASLSDWTRLMKEIRGRTFDLALLLPNSFESALMMFLGRVPERVGYATDGRRWMLTRSVPPKNDLQHQVHYYLDLVKALTAVGAVYDRPLCRPGEIAGGQIEIRATGEERTNARMLLNAEGISGNEPFLVLNPGAAYGSAKRWHADRFAAVADDLAHDLDLRVTLIGSEKERIIAEEIRDSMKAPAAVLTGKTSLETLIGVLAESSLMITNDSGPMHIAAALGVPTVAIFGSTDERVTGPYGPRTRIVKHPVECSPCLLRECPIDHRCMDRVSVEDVCQAARELMQS